MTESKKPTVAETTATQNPPTFVAPTGVPSKPAESVIVTPPPAPELKPEEPVTPSDEAPVDNADELVEDELTALKKRALFLGLKFHPNIGLDNLREKVNLHLRNSGAPTGPDKNEIEGGPVQEEEVKDQKPTEYSFEELQQEFNPTVDTPGLSKAQRRNIALKDANRLVRVRITCMNPNKRDWAGEIFTISNSLVGTFKKYVPFNASEGYHVPNIIYQAILERKCQVFVTGTDSRGQRVKRAASIQEFGVEVLPSLTPEELKSLAQRQAMANGTGN